MSAAADDGGSVLCPDSSSALSSSFSVLLLTRIDPTAALQLKQSGCGNSPSSIQQQAKDGVSTPLPGLERRTDDQNSIAVVHQPDGSCLVASGMSPQQLVSISSPQLAELIAFGRPVPESKTIDLSTFNASSLSSGPAEITDPKVVSSFFPLVPLRTLDRTIEQLKNSEHAFLQRYPDFFLVSREGFIPHASPRFVGPPGTPPPEPSREPSTSGYAIFDDDDW
jgi:hypothetical protein